MGTQSQEARKLEELFETGARNGDGTFLPGAEEMATGRTCFVSRSVTLNTGRDGLSVTARVTRPKEGRPGR